MNSTISVTLNDVKRAAPRPVLRPRLAAARALRTRASERPAVRSGGIVWSRGCPLRSGISLEKVKHLSRILGGPAHHLDGHRGPAATVISTGIASIPSRKGAPPRGTACGAGRITGSWAARDKSDNRPYSTVRGTCQVFRQDSERRVLRQSSCDGPDHSPLVGGQGQ